MTGSEHQQQTRMLAIYLNDHLTGATGGLGLARRLARALHNDPHGQTMARLAGEIDEDRATLIRLMRSLDIEISRIKPALGWLGEKIGRLKLNGALVRRSPLSTLVELEAMRLGVEGKAAGWRTLHRIPAREGALDPDELQRLIDRAERQIEELENLRKSAAADLFG